MCSRGAPAGPCALVLYAAHAWIQCPLTLDYAIFERELDKVAIDKNDSKTNRTAIGSAIGLSVSNLNRISPSSIASVMISSRRGASGHRAPKSVLYECVP